MCNLTLIIVIVAVLIILEMIVFVQKFETPEERERHASWLIAGIILTLVVGYVLTLYFHKSHHGDQEYGFFKKKRVAPVVAVAPGVGRKVYGNPMKKPDYKISSKYDEPVAAWDIYGGASAAADLNRNALYKKK